jgi:hypothetical protein
MEASRRVLVSIAVLGITSAADSNVAVALGDAVAVIAVSVETPTRPNTSNAFIPHPVDGYRFRTSGTRRRTAIWYAPDQRRPSGNCHGGDNDGGQNAWLTYRVSRSGGPVNEYYLASR